MFFEFLSLYKKLVAMYEIWLTMSASFLRLGSMGKDHHTKILIIIVNTFINWIVKHTQNVF